MQIFDLGINYGASYSINFATDIIVNSLGLEQRRPLYSQPLIKVAIGNKPITKTELDYIRAFFDAVEGRLGEFEIRDWSDYQVTGGTLGPVIEGRQSVIKTYTVGGESVSRLLTAVDEDTIVDDGGSISCEFNIPVRFDQDEIRISFEAYSASQENLFMLADLTCTEVRKQIPTTIEAIPASISADLNLGKDYGTLGGNAYSTQIASLPSGWDNRQANYSAPLGKWNIGDRILNKAELSQFIAMFRVCRGRVANFNFYDWQTEESKSVRFDSDSMGFQFEAYGLGYYGEDLDESLFAINGVPVTGISESPTVDFYFDIRADYYGSNPSGVDDVLDGSYGGRDDLPWRTQGPYEGTSLQVFFDEVPGGYRWTIYFLRVMVDGVNVTPGGAWWRSSITEQKKAFTGVSNNRVGILNPRAVITATPIV